MLLMLETSPGHLGGNDNEDREYTLLIVHCCTLSFCHLGTETSHRHHICQKIYATAILGLKNLRKKSGICDKTSSGQNNVNALKWPLIAYLV